jgi:hypothetical protein
MAIMAPRITSPVHGVGFAGMGMVLTAAVWSPAGFLGQPVAGLLALLGFGGLAVCAVSLVWTPRWPGIVGLVVGTLCVGMWVCFFVTIDRAVERAAARFGLTVPQYAQMCMAAQALTEAGESQRLPSGGPAPAVALGAVPAEYLTDPWSRPYRYAPTNSPRGFTFISDGPDGVAGTSDDIDLMTIQSLGTFELPPISGKGAAGPGGNAPGGR